MKQRDGKQFTAAMAMRRRFDAQLNPMELNLSRELLDFAFNYYLEGWYAAIISEYDGDLETGCADDNDEYLAPFVRSHPHG